HGLEERQVDLARVREEIEAIDAQFVQVQNEAKEKKDALVAKAPDQVVHLQVVGPAGYQPDAPSPLRIMTRDVAGKPRPSQIVTRVLSEAKKELFRSEASSTGDLLVSLPAGLTTAEEMARLVVEAASGDARARIEQTIRVQEPALVSHLALNKSVFQV